MIYEPIDDFYCWEHDGFWWSPMFCGLSERRIWIISRLIKHLQWEISCSDWDKAMTRRVFFGQRRRKHIRGHHE